ncbi:MAG: 4Fe-4S cluster-binding domain-containing protein [Firmicutes bacterium]|nr:4Fe-4S cluster-binding domain-containing protein [Bacillota bacterium]
MVKQLSIPKPLGHCGIMPNYQCTAACRHCLYACSPSFSGGYMAESVMDEMFSLLRKGGCRSVHIGGGEPFLDFDGLLTLLAKAQKFGIAVDYVETNGCWATDENTVAKHLLALEKVGADTFCISVDPFHAEYVPYAYPLRLAEICRKKGFGYFLWQERFLNIMRSVDPNTAHDRADLEKSIGRDYILDTATAYGIRMGGRAINIEIEYYPPKPLEKVLSPNPCRGLVSTGHFHVDMYNRFIPPGCTGLVLPMEDVVRGIQPGKYPVYEALYFGGVAALYGLAKEHGFQPAPEGYTSGCALCFFIRKYLSEKGIFAELEPEHYTEAMRYK